MKLAMNIAADSDRTAYRLQVGTKKNTVSRKAKSSIQRHNTETKTIEETEEFRIRYNTFTQIYMLTSVENAARQQRKRRKSQGIRLPACLIPRKGKALRWKTHVPEARVTYLHVALFDEKFLDIVAKLLQIPLREVVTALDPRNPAI